MRKLVWLRRFSQVIFTGIFIYVLWSTTYPLKGSLSPQVLFKVDPLIMFMTALSERVLLPGLIFAAAMVLLTALLGRFFCGWVCPLGAFIDGAGALRARGRRDLVPAARQKLRVPKFYILGGIVLLALAFSLAGCPAEDDDDRERRRENADPLASYDVVRAPAATPATGRLQHA